MIKAFYSDPHFGHTNIIGYCERPFSDIEEMNRELVHRYNAMIKPDDAVIWLGDCFFKDDPDKYRSILMEMAGTKLLIPGNHDRSDQEMAELGFDFVLASGSGGTREALMYIAGRTCRLSHYPYGYVSEPVDKPDKYRAQRPKRREGEILIHGHTHAKDKVNGVMINVGVDAWNYGPATYREVAELVRSMP